MRFGISIVIPGIYVSSSSAMSSAMINGTHSLINSCILQPVMDTQVNIIEPNGGVRPPIMMLTLHTIKTIQIYCFKVYGVWYPKEPELHIQTIIYLICLMHL